MCCMYYGGFNVCIKPQKRSAQLGTQSMWILPAMPSLAFADSGTVAKSKEMSRQESFDDW